ncbi:MAG: tetratricopeptide repeat protein [Flavobacteriales bacterium]|nr:tetratricopeptide repeat protein [Flavobacteriales bacterium]
MIGRQVIASAAIICLLLFFMGMSAAVFGQKQRIPENIMRKDAEKYFDQGDYQGALGSYSDLAKYHPKNVEYSMKYGLCLLYTDSIKSSCLKYLYYAATQTSSTPESYYNLALAYHLNYKLDDAITYYNKFKAVADKKLLEKYDPDLRIQMCKNAKKLMQNPVSTKILSRKSVNNSFYTSAYGVLLIDASIAFVPPILQTKLDRQHSDKATMCTYNRDRLMIYSSYGKSESNGRDLYRKMKLGRNEWSKPQRFGENVNTKADENFPFVLSESRVMYYCSNGAMSMGGYDIFRTEWDELNSRWQPGTNIGYPINTVFDDILFVPKPDDKEAYLASDRNSPAGLIEIIKIKFPKERVTTAVIKGQFSVVNEENNKTAQISLIDIAQDQLVGIYNTDKKHGGYIMALTPDRKYKLIVKVKGFEEQVVVIYVPKMEKWYLLKQIIKISRTGNVETLNAFNFFTESEANLLNSVPTEELLAHHKNAAVNEIKVRNDDSGEENKSYSKLNMSEISKSINKKMSSEELTLQTQADNYYALTDYASAMKIYYDLLTTYPDHPENNLKMGISVYHAGKDKSVPIPYLKQAGSIMNSPSAVHYYLGRCYHLLGKYDLAIKSYTAYKNVVSQEEVNEKNIMQLLQQCKFGEKTKLQAPSFEIINKKSSSADAVYFSLNGYEFFGKILKTLEDFKSKVDQKKNFESTMYLTRDNNTIYYPSYGDNKDGSIDIYRRIRLFSGDWSPPKYLAGINSDADENYPFYTSDGVLHFSSKRKNGFGGYDVFKSKASPDNLTWSKPANVGTLINTPYDDIYFISCKDGESGYFASDRGCQQGYMTIFNIRKK